MKKTSPFSFLGHVTALITFAIATVICGVYFFTGNLDFGFIGYFFFLLAVPINLIILMILVIKSSKVEDPERLKSGIRLMILNIPVAILYFGFGMYFIGVMRITIENNTGSDIKKIKIIGCEDSEFEMLKNGDSETVWIDINGDCSISMSYLDSKGEIQDETIVGYVTGGMGTKYTYRVGRGEAGW